PKGPCVRNTYMTMSLRPRTAHQPPLTQTHTYTHTHTHRHPVVRGHLLELYSAGAVPCLYNLRALWDGTALAPESDVIPVCNYRPRLYREGMYGARRFNQTHVWTSHLGN